MTFSNKCLFLYLTIAVSQSCCVNLIIQIWRCEGDHCSRLCSGIYSHQKREHGQLNLPKPQEVNKAGDGVFVILHLYKQGVPLCALVNEYMNRLAPRFPTTKFIRAISTTCIPNYPDKNLPTIFVYHEGAMKSQIIGPEQMRGMNLTEKEFEFMLGKSGAIETDIKEDPKPKVSQYFDQLIPLLSIIPHICHIFSTYVICG